MVAITAQNGALPSSALVSIGGGKVLRADAAASYLRCLTEGMPTGVTSAYRTKAEQKALLDLYGYPHAEYPGRSQHGEGVALDLPEPARTWMVQYGATHGWRRTVMPAEPWHFEYVPALDHHRSSPPTQEDDMPTADEVAAAVWKMALGPMDSVPGDPAWIHLLAIRSRAGALAAQSRDVGGSKLGPADVTTWAADARIDAMRAANYGAGLVAQVAALTEAVKALASSQGADPDAVADAAERGARAALADLRITIEGE